MKKLYYTIVLLFFASVYTIAQTANITVYRNISYAPPASEFKGDTSSDRALDLYLPASQGQKNVPIILFIHGGGFVGGDKQGTAQICKGLAGLGYAVASINYRLELKLHRLAMATKGLATGLPDGGKFNVHLAEAIKIADEDAQLALRWIKQNAGQYKLDSSSLVVGGGSAGAITALYTVYASQQQILPVKAVINFWGALENAAIITKGAPPLITYHGNKDDKIHIAYAHAIDKVLKINNDTLSETHIMEGKGHAMYDYIAKQKLTEIDAFLHKVLQH